MSENLLAAEVYDRLQQAMASDREGFCDLYRDYLAEARHTLADLRAALAQRQPEILRQKAHYLKSSSAVLGVRPLARSCAALEEAGKIIDLAAAEECLAEAAQILDLVQAELVRRLGARVVPPSASAA